MVRVRAALAGEVSAGIVESYQDAGGAVADLYVGAEQRRGELLDALADLWDLDFATQAQFLCCWNGFALQTLGDAFLTADYRADPKTVDFLPRVTERQALAFYSEVEPWVSRAHQAQSNPQYRFDLTVPALLPAWITVDPCPHAHLDAMLAACSSMHDHAELAVNDAEHGGGDRHPGDLAGLRQSLAAVSSAADHAASLDHHHAPRELHERIEQAIKGAIEGAYRLGQLAAMPQLISNPESVPGGRTILPGPEEPGFDPWCLTDPQSRGKLGEQSRRSTGTDPALAARSRPPPHPLDPIGARGRACQPPDRICRRPGWQPARQLLLLSVVPDLRGRAGDHACRHAPT